MSHITTLQENGPILQEIFNVQTTVGRKKDAHKLQNLEQRRAWEDEIDKTTSGDDFSHLKCKIDKKDGDKKWSHNNMPVTIPVQTCPVCCNP